MPSLFNRRGARWAVPAAIVGAIALGTWIPTVAASASTPNLPSITAAQLLAKASHPTITAFSGSIDMTANLGLPDLSSVDGEGGQSAKTAAGFDPTTLLSGTHQISVWDNGADQQRLALPSSLAETDFVHNGNQAYLYDSSTQTVTHLVAASKDGSTGGHASSDAATDGVPVTPEQAAQRFLDHIDPSTTVSVTSPVYVAGRSTYRLALSPKAGTAGASSSTVSEVAMSVDSQTGMVLSVSVDPKGSTTPALELAFTSFDPSAPAASNFDAPMGTTTKTETVGGGNGGGGRHGTNGDQGKTSVTGAPWAQVLTVGHANLGKSGSELTSVTTPVTGSFGSARLLSTSLVNALVFPDGRIMVGFVTPSALEAAASAG